MRRTLLALCLALCLALALPLAAQVVEESLPRDPGPLDFIVGEGFEQWIFQSLAGDALVGLSPEGRVVPRLARSWAPRPGGGLRFVLREARFCDGTLVTAEDVVWTFRQILADPKASPTKRAILEGAEAGLDTEGPWIRSPKPKARLLMELARVPIARKGYPHCGSGPYAYQREAGAWRFTRRDHFLKPAVEGIRFRLLADAAGVHAALEKGWLSIGAPTSRRQTEVPSTHRLVTQPMHAQLVVWSREGSGPLRLLERWRRDAFPPRLLGLNAKPSRGLWPESLGFEPQAVASASAPLKSGLRLQYGTGDEVVERLLLALRERARRDGVDLALDPLEPGLLVDRLQRGEFRLACYMVIFDPHPWSVLEYLEPKGPMNFTGWVHPDLGNLTARLQDPESPSWRELQALWARNPAALPLLDFQSVIWVDRRLEVIPSPLGLYLHTPGAAGWRWRP
jgi:hypothetical protein